MKFFRVKNWDKWQDSESKRAEKRGGRHYYLKFGVDTFHDPVLATWSAMELMGWVGLLVAAKRGSNRLPWDSEAILRSAGLQGKRVVVNLDKMIELGLIELVGEEKQRVIEPVSPATDVPAKAKAAKTRKPSGLGKTEGEMAIVDTPENRQGVDDVNQILGRELRYTLDHLGMIARLLAAGYTREDWRRVLAAMRDRSTYTAKFAIDGNSPDKPGPWQWGMRPGESGGFAKILSEASKANVVAFPQPAVRKTEEEMRAEILAEEERDRERMRGVRLG